MYWWPVVRVLPMGWAHSVHIGQAIHMAIVVRAGLKLEDSFQRTKEIAVGLLAHGEYIDDFFAIGTNKDLITQSLSAMIRTCEKVNVPAKLSKVVYPDVAGETLILGITLAVDGRATPTKTNKAHGMDTTGNPLQNLEYEEN
jgi:hypothetical protein